MSERDPRDQHLRTCEQGPECLEATRKAIWQDFATQRAARELPTTTTTTEDDSQPATGADQASLGAATV